MKAKGLEVTIKGLIPAFSLFSSEGKQIRALDYRGNRNLVLVFTGSPDTDPYRQFLFTLAQEYDKFVRKNSEILVIMHGSVEKAEQVKSTNNLPFPVLADENGQIHLAVGAVDSKGDPALAVYVTDRFNEIRAIYRTGQGDFLPTMKEILDELDFIEVQCPE